MKKELLTILGCSGSLAIALMTASGANADTLPAKEFVFTASPGESLNEEFREVNCGCNADGADNWTEADGERALAVFGCDCAGCRRIARTLTEEGTLAQ